MTNTAIKIEVVRHSESISIDDKSNGFDNELIQAFKDAKKASPWGWCMIEVVASIPLLGLYAREYLGGCSYESKKDFIDNSGYYADMVKTAKESLLVEYETLKKNIGYVEKELIA